MVVSWWIVTFVRSGIKWRICPRITENNSQYTVMLLRDSSSYMEIHISWNILTPENEIKGTYSVSINRSCDKDSEVDQTRFSYKSFGNIYMYVKSSLYYPEFGLIPDLH